MKFYGHGVGKDIKIQTSKGLVNAESLKKFHNVVDYRSETKSKVNCRESTSLGFLRIKTEANFQVACAPFQKFLSECGEVIAEDIQQYDLVWTVKGLLQVVSVEHNPVMLSVVRFLSPDIVLSAGGLLTVPSEKEIEEK